MFNGFSPMIKHHVYYDFFKSRCKFGHNEQETLYIYLIACIGISCTISSYLSLLTFLINLFIRSCILPSKFHPSTHSPTGIIHITHYSISPAFLSLSLHHLVLIHLFIQSESRAGNSIATVNSLFLNKSGNCKFVTSLCIG